MACTRQKPKVPTKAITANHDTEDSSLLEGEPPKSLALNTGVSSSIRTSRRELLRERLVP